MTYDIGSTSEYKVGRKYEELAQDIIKQANNVSIVLEQTGGNFRHVLYDFKTSDDITYEVKADLQSYMYKNFFIAYEQRFADCQHFVPAGICKTKADYYLLLYGDCFYMIKTATLIEHILNNKYSIGGYRNNRGNTIRGYKVPVTDLHKDSIIYNIPSI